MTHSLWEKLNQDAISKGESGYMDPESGLFVLTSLYLKERGYCCDNGCRHCPWDKQDTSQ